MSDTILFIVSTGVFPLLIGAYLWDKGLELIAVPFLIIGFQFSLFGIAFFTLERRAAR